MISFYIWITTFVFGFLSVVWKNSNGFNVFLRFVFTVITVTGIIILYKNNGFSGIELKF